ncbi:hypothetical protein B0H16DRAFT_970302, partial [Mycena metata]
MSMPKSFASATVWTLDPRKLTRASFIDVPARGKLRVDLPSGTMRPVNVFDHAHPDYLIKGSYLAGFFYYHVPYPPHFLSGSIRFRCTRDGGPYAFVDGHNLPNRAGLPWGLDLPTLFQRPQFDDTWRRQLVLDGLLSEVQMAAARRLLAQNSNPAERPPFIHDITQPFIVDFTQGMRIAVLGPNTVLKASLYPPVAYTGAAVVCFEPTGDGSEALRARVVTPLPNYHIHSPYDPNWSPEPILTRYLQKFRHIPPLRAGDLLPHPFDPAVPWVWAHDEKQAAHSAALHCLFHPPMHFPSQFSPADDVIAGRIRIRPRQEGLLMSKLQQQVRDTPYTPTRTEISPLVAAEMSAGVERLVFRSPMPPSTASSTLSTGLPAPSTPVDVHMAAAVAQTLYFSSNHRQREVFLAQNKYILNKDELAKLNGDGERTGSPSGSTDVAAPTATNP